MSFDAIPNISVMASTFPQAHEQESFGSFLQKRTASFCKPLISLDFFRDLDAQTEVFNGTTNLLRKINAIDSMRTRGFHPLARMLAT